VNPLLDTYEDYEIVLKMRDALQQAEKRHRDKHKDNSNADRNAQITVTAHSVETDTNENAAQHGQAAGPITAVLVGASP
jgi:hypothetical protein